MKESGNMIIKGLGYEDVVNNLTRNGYDVTIKVSANTNPTTALYRIKYKPSSIDEDMELPFY